jgi:hypothetical protein
MTMSIHTRLAGLASACAIAVLAVTSTCSLRAEPVAMSLIRPQSAFPRGVLHLADCSQQDVQACDNAYNACIRPGSQYEALTRLHERPLDVPGKMWCSASGATMIVLPQELDKRRV